MTTGPSEQRNPYKGSPPRPWIRVRLAVPDGTTEEVELLADTGNPCAIIISQAAMTRLPHGDAPGMNTNFGPLGGGWLHVCMPELGLEQDVLGFASDMVVTATTASNPNFEGLAGLPLLRLFEYGGDADWFWLRPAHSLP